MYIITLHRQGLYLTLATPLCWATTSTRASFCMETVISSLLILHALSIIGVFVKRPIFFSELQRASVRLCIKAKPLSSQTCTVQPVFTGSASTSACASSSNRSSGSRFPLETCVPSTSSGVHWTSTSLSRSAVWTTSTTGSSSSSSSAS